MGGEVPFFENWPELWIHQDQDFEKAQMILEPLRTSRKAANTTENDQANWTCPNCGESNAGNFALCWSCGFELQEV